MPLLKRCPYCEGKIKLKAVKCEYCHKRLDGQSVRRHRRKATRLSKSDQLTGKLEELRSEQESGSISLKDKAELYVRLTPNVIRNLAVQFWWFCLCMMALGSGLLALSLTGNSDLSNERFIGVIALVLITRKLTLYAIEYRAENFPWVKERFKVNTMRRSQTTEESDPIGDIEENISCVLMLISLLLFGWFCKLVGWS